MLVSEAAPTVRGQQQPSVLNTPRCNYYHPRPYDNPTAIFTHGCDGFNAAAPCVGCDFDRSTIQ